MKVQMTKSEWYKAGGFQNPRLFRKQKRSGGWCYFKVLDYDRIVF